MPGCNCKKRKFMYRVMKRSELHSLHKTRNEAQAVAAAVGGTHHSNIGTQYGHEDIAEKV